MKKILLLDEDEKHVPEFVDTLKSEGFLARQERDWRKVQETIREFEPDILLLDLMMPGKNPELGDTFGGYLTGFRVYERLISREFPLLKFAVFSAIDEKLSVVKNELAVLQKNPSYRGFFSKNDIDTILDFLRK